MCTLSLATLAWSSVVSPSWAAPPVSAEMHERFLRLTDSRDLAIQGDLEQAKEAAAALAALEPPRRMPRKWRGWVTQVDAHATSVTEATTLAAATVRLGRTAGACGSCHAAERGGPSLVGAAQVPEQAWREGANMPLHKWAVDWMWVGLVAHDDEAWRRGAGELANRPVAFAFPATEASPERTALEQEVYALADKAAEAEVGDRPELMGKLLATCAACHTLPPEAPAAPSEAPTEE